MYSPEAMRTAEKRLAAAGTLFYHDWPTYQWAMKSGKMLTQEQVDAMCIAWLDANPAAQANSPAPAAPASAPVSAPVPAPDLAARPALLTAATEGRDKRKGGRPTLPPGQKLACISTLVSAARFAELHEQSKELGISVSRLVRPLVEPSCKLGRRGRAYRTGSGLSVAQRQQQRELAGMSGDLRQLVRQARADGLVEIADQLLALAADIRTVLGS